jgi:uncharacterized protein YecT (DUF1311 family)/tRNA A-37 threonylcarbamoyl transferase component Bud32
MSTHDVRSSDFPPELHQLEDEFELLREIGRGAVTAVYLARERASARLVAIKAVRRRYLDDEEAMRRFAREAELVADLDHPNIVRTHGVRAAGDRGLAIVLEFVQGPTLRDALVDDVPFPIALAERVVADVAAALVYAHSRGLVHRDVKPENIFIDEESGRVLLSDFGIARTLIDDPHLTRVGMIVGTPTYMSPEQVDGRGVDGRSDVYSLGLVGWEMLTGRRPWAGQSTYNVMYSNKHASLPPIAFLRPETPRALRLAIEGALFKDREQRGDASMLLSRLSDLELPRADAREVHTPVAPVRIGAAEREVWAAEPSHFHSSARLPLAFLAILLLAGGVIAADYRRLNRGSDAGRIAALSRADSLRLCETPDNAHQRACLVAQLASNDVELDRAYQALLIALRGRSPRDLDARGEEPAPARALRGEQQEWLDIRHRDCRVETAERAGGRWALAVSRCLVDRGARRSAELRSRLAGLEPAG